MGKPTFADFATVAAKEPDVIVVEQIPNHGPGFWVRLRNGWTVSVQCGPLNYCDLYNHAAIQAYYTEHMIALSTNKRLSEQFAERCLGITTTAEIAYFPKEGGLCAFDFDIYTDTVKGHVKRDDVLAFIREVAAYPKES